MILNPPIKNGNLTFKEVFPIYFDNTQSKRLYAIFPPITGKGFVLMEGEGYNEEWTSEEAEAIIQSKIDSGEFAELLAQ